MNTQVIPDRRPPRRARSSDPRRRSRPEDLLTTMWDVWGGWSSPRRMQGLLGWSILPPLSGGGGVSLAVRKTLISTPQGAIFLTTSLMSSSSGCARSAVKHLAVAWSSYVLFILSLCYLCKPTFWTLGVRIKRKANEAPFMTSWVLNQRLSMWTFGNSGFLRGKTQQNWYCSRLRMKADLFLTQNPKLFVYAGKSIFE